MSEALVRALADKRKDTELADVARGILRINIGLERGIDPECVTVVEHELFPEGDRWGNIGQVTVKYQPGMPYMAVYGFNHVLNVACYMD